MQTTLRLPHMVRYDTITFAQLLLIDFSLFFRSVRHGTWYAPFVNLPNSVHDSPRSYSHIAPYQNSSLLQTFSTLLTIEQTYTVQVEFLSDSAMYTLLDAAGQVVLEKHSIRHTPCSNYKQGYKLGLYFGGQCPAPSAVTVCYSDPDTTKA